MKTMLKTREPTLSEDRKPNRHSEFVMDCEHVGGNVWSPEALWAIRGQNSEVTRCYRCKWGTVIGTGKLVHCKLHDRMTLLDDFCSMGARSS